MNEILENIMEMIEIVNTYGPNHYKVRHLLDETRLKLKLLQEDPNDE